MAKSFPYNKISDKKNGNLISQKIKWKQVFRFIICISLAFIFWIFERSLNVDKFELSLPVSYYNLPPRYRLVKSLPDSLTMKLTGKTSDFLSAQFFLNSETLRVDLSRYYQKKIVDLKRETIPFRKKIKEYNLDAVEYTSMFPMEILDAVNKEVTVRSDLKIKYRDGFLEDRPVEFIPPKVTLLGDPQVLKEYEGWYTVSKEIELTGGTDTFNISLLEGTGMDVIPPKVKAVLHSSKYTEVEIQKDLKLKEDVTLGGATVDFFPKSVKVKLLVPVFMVGNSFTLRNTRVEVDVSQINPEGQWIAPVIKDLPYYVRGARCEPPYVQFLVTQPMN